MALYVCSQGSIELLLTTDFLGYEFRITMVFIQGSPRIQSAWMLSSTPYSTRRDCLVSGKANHKFDRRPGTRSISIVPKPLDTICPFTCVFLWIASERITVSPKPNMKQISPQKPQCILLTYCNWHLSIIHSASESGSWNSRRPPRTKLTLCVV